jgi:uncharacterized protein
MFSPSPSHFLSQIVIYPIKSLDGVCVTSAQVLGNGALSGDRRLALVDRNGKIVNAKRFSQIHRIRASFDLGLGMVSLEDENGIETFSLDGDRAQMAAWFSDFFGFGVNLIEEQNGGFPDDLASPAATVISTATLEVINSWFPELSLSEIRSRFRTNLEIDALEIDEVPAFWEDRLFGKSDRLIPFQIGTVKFLGVNPCQRCPVPGRDSNTGIPTPDFQKTFGQQRQATFPDWGERSRFNHFYRLAVNTRIATDNQGDALHYGDLLITE